MPEVHVGLIHRLHLSDLFLLGQAVAHVSLNPSLKLRVRCPNFSFALSLSSVPGIPLAANLQP